MPWTTAEQIQQPSSTLWRGCTCPQHVHPLEHERVQHNILHRHRYKAFTKAQGLKQQTDANISVDRVRMGMLKPSQIAREREATRLAAVEVRTIEAASRVDIDRALGIE